MRTAIVPAIALALVGCSPTPEAAKKAVLEPVAGPATTTSKHPWAKFLEVGGIRLAEAGPGKLRIKFIAVNHSEADFSELTLKLSLRTSVGKPADPPLAEFEVKVPPLGPFEIKDVTVTVDSKLRAYEFPDWQFLRAEFDIMAPQP
jgi:hypothetical protein